MRFVVIFSLGIFFYSSTFALDLLMPESAGIKGSKVVLPSYILSSSDSNDKLSIYGPNYVYFNRSFDSCSKSTKPYSKLESPSQHEGFPSVSQTPVVDDSLATYFFKENSTGKFLLSKWGGNSFPLIQFHMTKESKKYRKNVEKVIGYLNQKAIQYQLISYGESLVELADGTISLEDESCDLHLIHFDKYKPMDEDEAVTGMTISKTDYVHDNRLGETIDSDIIIYPNALKKLGYKQQEKIEEELFDTLLHEILHALRVTHNFALGTVVDYSPRTYQGSLDKSLEYEMDVLAFLYNDKSPSKTWPLIRSLKKGIYETEEKHFFRPEYKYEAEIIDNTLKFICKDLEGREFDYSDRVYKNFDITFNYKSNSIPYLTFAEMGGEIENLIDENLFGENQVFGFRENKQRLYPVLKPDIMSYFPNGIDRDKSQIYIGMGQSRIVYPSIFVENLTGKDMKSFFDWTISIQKGDKIVMSCTLKAQFDILP
ncbi:MAG: hypothetical protein KDD52_00735 [Bdellovibrionales bacterium]|nr:hypothetical protein [Bdellovibrionales bacterium]